MMLDPGRTACGRLPSAAGWKLVVNKQTGQWGTAYDGKQDSRPHGSEDGHRAEAGGELHDHGGRKRRARTAR